MSLSLRFADLFAGIGGFRLAFERAGGECVYANERDKWACEVYRGHFGAGELEECDIRDVEGLPGVDLVTGGWPCQDLSVAGKREGLSGARSGLFWEMMRLVRGAKPQWVVFENVPGLLSSQRGRDFGEVLGALDECGYDACWRVLDARHFGVPQRRRRVFIVGGLRGRGGDPAEVLFEPEGCEGDFTPGEGGGEDIACAIGSRVGQHPPQAATFIIDQDPMAVRRLLPVECERLQGFPDGWTEGVSDTQRYKALGNAVCVPVVEWIARRLVEQGA